MRIELPSHTALFDDLSCSTDGAASNTEDCDDADPTVNPEATTEYPADGVDQNCDGFELCFVDADDDGFGSATVETQDLLCNSEDIAPGDCDDDNGAVNPNEDELTADGVDQNCDGLEQCYADVDGDGFAFTPVLADDIACEGTADGKLLSRTADDCNDDDVAIYPGADEVAWDGIDQDCDDKDLEIWLGGTGCATTGSGFPAASVFAGLLLLARRRLSSAAPTIAVSN